jgi:hypothetical protein
MPLRVSLNILNQKGTPAFYSDIFANRPAFGYAGRVFISTDTGAIYEDTGSAWTLIADAGAGTTGTLQQVTTNGNTTTQGISITAGGLSSNTVNVNGNGTTTGGSLSIKQYATAPTNVTGYNSISSQTSGHYFSASQGGSFKNFLFDPSSLTDVTLRQYTMPNANGTLALTSDLTTGYVPYTGATSVLDMGDFGIRVGGTSGSYLGFKQFSGGTSGATGYTSIYAQNKNTIAFAFNQSAGVVKTFSFVSDLIADNTGYTYYAPAITGTLALSTYGSALTSGSVLFVDTTGTITQKNSNFFWDNTNNRLGINTASPGASLDIHSTGTAAHFNGTGTNNVYVLFQNAGTSKWRIGNTYSAGANNLEIYNNTLAANALSFVGSTNAANFGGNVDINGIGTLTSTGSTQLFLKSTGGGSNRNWQIQTSESAAGDLSIMQSTTAGGSTYATKVNIGSNGYFSIGTAPAKLGLQVKSGASSAPATSGTTPNGTAMFTPSDGNNSLFFGAYGTSPYANWIQSSDISSLNVNYPISIQPNGGNVLIGTTTDNGNGKLQVNGNVTFGAFGSVLTATTTNVTTSTVNVGNTTGSGIGCLYYAAWYNNSGGAQGVAILMVRGSTLVTVSISDGSGAAVVFSASSGMLRANTTVGSVTMGVSQINI